jgi:hypothetical protein
MPYSHEKGRKFWYEFDKASKYNSTFMPIVRRARADVIQTAFFDVRDSNQYPAKFVEFIAPQKADWIKLADVQTQTIATFLGTDWNDIQAAFEDFGQGVLLDTAPERRANNDSIHTMDIQGAAPPVGYHRWHASIRAIQLLQIGDQAWWERLDEILGLAWAIQSFAKPKQQDNAPNPFLPEGDMQALRNAWLGMTPDRRDRQYDTTGDVGYHETPKNPVP